MKSTIKFSVLTIFPKVIEAFLTEGLVAQAAKKGLFSWQAVNPRDFTEDAHRSVDDRTFGGGDGMVMMFEPLAKAVDSIKAANATGNIQTKVVLLTPQGKLWQQSLARRWVEEGSDVILVCGRYAGVDYRFAQEYCDEEISIGDYVLNGGELAACVIMESMVRLIPEVLGNKLSAEKDSFSDGLLEAPAFTRPREVRGKNVPAPLLSGNHSEIAKFEKAVALVRTKKLRPDLWREGWDADLKSAINVLVKVAPEDLNRVGLNVEDLQWRA
jgi:tRNA (guanine37-N1)-methyltransferase